MSKLTKDISDAKKWTKRVRPTLAHNAHGRKSTSHYYTTWSSQNQGFTPYSRARTDNFLSKPLSDDEREKGGNKQAINEPQNNTPLNQLNLSDCYLNTFDEVKKVVDNQTAFRERQIQSLHSWYEITNDPTIIQIVKGVYIKFRQNYEPTQMYARPSLFNSKEHTIVHEEINKLMLKGVLKESHTEQGEFICPIFLRPKPDSSHLLPPLVMW